MGERSPKVIPKYFYTVNGENEWDNMKKTSINVDEGLWKDAKKLAIDEGTTIGLLVEKALKEYVKKGR